MAPARRAHAALRRATQGLRGVRARLVATFVLSAALVALAGILVFTVVLGHALGTNVDADLRAAADAYALDVSSNGLDHATPVRVPVANHDERPVSAIAVVLDPAGRPIEVEPAALASGLRDLLTTPSRSSVRTVSFAGTQYRVRRQRVAGTGGTWTVAVGQSLAPSQDAAADARDVLYVLVPVAVLLAGIGAWLLAGAALRPVDRMRIDAQRLADTGATGTIRVPAGGDGLTRLAVTFNELLQRLHLLLDRQRSLVADAGHELRTPLAVLKTELQTAVRPGRSRSDIEDSVAHAEQEAARLAALAEDLLLLAQADGRERIVRVEPCDAGVLVEQALATITPRFDTAGVGLHADLPRSPLDARLDPVAFRRIVDNLLTNAVNHTPPGGAVSVTVRPTGRRTGEAITLDVSDTGIGFPREFLPHAFDRFARADQSRTRSGTTTGTGLGLAIVAALTRAHGGTVTAENLDAGGARVVVTLPRRPA